MAKLYFRYGAMGSSKTANALMVRYNYLEKGQQVVMLKPRMDTRDPEHVLRSRSGLEGSCQFVEDFLAQVADWEREAWYDCAAVIVDEAQFLTEKQVDQLSELVDVFGIPVLCYGLRTDFQSHFFEGARRLMEIADVIEQVPTVCWCGKRAHFNARVRDGKIVREGAQVEVGGNELYMSLCRRHFKLGQLHADPEERTRCLYPPKV